MSIAARVGDIEISSDYTIEATGWLVGPRHLITNQHVVIDSDGTPFRADQISVKFANGTSARAEQSFWFPHPEFYDGDRLIAPQNTQHDFAFVLLDRDIGLQNGYFRYAKPDQFDLSKLNFAGYPSDVFGGDTLYFDTITARYNPYGNYLLYDSPFSVPGTSGSPIYYLDGNKPYVVGISSTGSGKTGTAGAISEITIERISAFVAGAFQSKSDFASSGNDVLLGSTNSDLIAGQAGKDQIKGLAGADILFGNAGNDRIFGDADDDVISGDSGSDKLYGGTGNDQLLGIVGRDVLRGHSGDDTLKGGTGRDKLFGHSGDDLLEGGSGYDTLRGSSGDDNLKGNKGDDALFGGSGSDRLRGGSGRDTLKGQSGDDNLWGGAGKDTFEFDLASGHDKVLDFDLRDTIRILEGADRKGDLNFTETKAGLLIEFGETDILIVDGTAALVPHITFDFG